MAKKKNNFVIPYDADTVNKLFNEFPKNVDDHYVSVVHLLDKSKIYPVGFSKSDFQVSTLDVLVDAKDMNKLTFSKVHGKGSYGRVLPHMHNIDMCLAVAIPTGVPFTVYTENVGIDSPEPVRKFTVFDKNHKQVNELDATKFENYNKLDENLRPLMSDTADTLKRLYFLELHPELVEKIDSNAKSYSDSFIKNNYFDRRAMSSVVRKFMPDLQSFDAFGVDSGAHQRYIDRNLVVSDSEAQHYSDYRAEKNRISKVDIDARKDFTERLKKYDSVVGERCMRELNVISDFHKTFQDIHKLFESEMAVVDITKDDLDAIDVDASKFVDKFDVSVDKSVNKSTSKSTTKTEKSGQSSDKMIKSGKKSSTKSVKADDVINKAKALNTASDEKSQQDQKEN